VVVPTPTVPPLKEPGPEELCWVKARAPATAEAAGVSSCRASALAWKAGSSCA
jgi:hypothetical protein